jgi:hypothetical protein
LGVAVRGYKTYVGTFSGILPKRGSLIEFGHKKVMFAEGCHGSLLHNVPGMIASRSAGILGGTNFPDLVISDSLSLSNLSSFNFGSQLKENRCLVLFLDFSISCYKIGY